MNKILKQSVGIPVEEVGQRLKELHDAIEANNMAVAAENDVSISFMPDGKAMSVQLRVYLLNKEGDKNGTTIQ